MEKKTIKALQEALSRGDKNFEFGAVAEQGAMGTVADPAQEPAGVSEEV